MKKGKQLFALSTASILLASSLGLTACGGGSSDSSSSSTTSSSSSAGHVSAVTDATLNIDASLTSLTSADAISDLLYGIFIEDINYAVDGGMYAELIKNRSFEFVYEKTPSYSALTADGPLHGWSQVGDSSYEVIAGEDAIATDNPQYLRLTNESGNPAGIANEGFFANINVTEGSVYEFTVFLKSEGGYEGDVSVTLTDGVTTYGTSTFAANLGEGWVKYATEFTATATGSAGVKCQVALVGDGTVDMDMVSLMPKDRAASVFRSDMYEMMEALNPTFVRFPGGCITEGDGLDDAYNWKDSIGNAEYLTINGVDADGNAYTVNTCGDAATRKTKTSGIWQGTMANPYYWTYGVGFYEYFLLCEALDALPVPTLSCGISCGGGAKQLDIEYAGENLQQYIDDAFDLIAFAKGDVNSDDEHEAYWAGIRAAMGHSEPFDLKYVGIGNEQGFITEYFPYYEQFIVALEEKKVENPELYGDIEWIVANGVARNDKQAWGKVKANATSGTYESYAGMVDEHYYTNPEWFLKNTDRYDDGGYYSRDTLNGTTVFLGEYASQGNKWWNAICEAAYMTGLEKNADVVTMASYAPLFGCNYGSQWTAADMMWFDATAVYGTPNYYVQQLYSTNVGTTMLNTVLESPTYLLEYTNNGNPVSSVVNSIHESVSYDANTGDIIIKIVNAEDRDVNVNVQIANLGAIESVADVVYLQHNDVNVVNAIGSLNVKPETKTIDVSDEFTYVAAKYSVTVIRIHPASAE